MRLSNLLLLLCFVVEVYLENNSELIKLCSDDGGLYNYTTNRSEICGCAKNNLCVRKCCKMGYYHFHDENPNTKKFISVCIPTINATANFNVPVYDGLTKIYEQNESFHIGMLNCRNPIWQYFKMNNNDPKERVYIQKNASLYFPHFKKIYSPERYCVDEEDGLTFYLCYTPDGGYRVISRLLVSSGMIISMPFLLATFLVYAILPESNLHRKALMNYVLTLLIAYILLVVVQLHPGSFDKIPCSLLGYTIIFFFLVSFFWMNVMCLDMWFAFRGMRGFNGRRIAEKKRFLMYFAYAFGVPLLHTLVVFGINLGGDPDSSYYPGVGIAKCFLNDGLPNLLYFYGPMAILITVNITLFILTAVKIQKVKKETSMLKHSDSKRHSYEDDKQKFNLYVKLLFAMGINWSMEVISWAIQWRTNNNLPLYVWYLTDFCNAVYGVFIFLIFVFKKKVWKSLKRRYYVLRGKPYFAHSTSVTQTTRASNYSHTESSMADHRLSEFKNGRGEERILRPH